jgi:hypothetical protein
MNLPSWFKHWIDTAVLHNLQAKLYIGKLGIGTSVPGKKLTVVDSNPNLTEVQFENSDWGSGETTQAVAINFRLSVGGTSQDDAGRITVGKDDDWDNAAAADSFMSFKVNLNGTLTEYMRILSTGSVGIGTTPTAPLHIRSSTATLLLQSDDGNSAIIIFGDASDSSRGHIEYTSGDNMIFKVNNLSEAMRIHDSRFVSIGNTTDDVALLNVSAADGVADAKNVAKFINSEATAGRNYGVHIQGGSNSSDESFSVRKFDNSATYLKVRGDGKIGIGTASPAEALHVVGKIVTTGDVGVGTTSPSEALHVVGKIVTTGDVGVGTTSPAEALHVVGKIVSTGYVGIGTTSPPKALTISGANTGGDQSRVRLVNTASSPDNTFDIIATSAKIQILQSGLTTANIEIGIQGFYPVITLEAGTGHVGINDSTPTEQLDVNGTVRADAFSEFSTPLPEEEALPIVLAMKNKSDGTIDHKTFPGYKKEEVSWEDQKDDKGIVIKKAGSKMKESVSISLQIKYALKAIQELRKEIDALKKGE